MADEQEHPHRRASTKAKAEEEEVTAEATDEAQAEEQQAELLPVNAISPYELPANTAAAQQYLAMGVVVDESIELPEEQVAAAQNEIALYGHPNDPRISGGSLVDNPLSPEDLAVVPAREIEMPEVEEKGWHTWGDMQGGETAEEEVAEEASKAEKKVEAKA